jgi:hypothetical protein
MGKNIILFIFLLIIFTGSGLYGTSPSDTELILINLNQPDTLRENQILYNGRVWRNLYYRVKEDQFLFSKILLPGSLTINGKTFKNISIMYDIYNDEIITPTNHGSILQLNKEMVDSFAIIFQNKTYKFTKIQEDSIKGFKGFVNVLYKGKTALYVKYKKEIELLSADDTFDKFYQTHRIYFVKDSIVYLVTGKREFFNLMDEYRVPIRSFIKKNRLRISKRNPESFVPVVQFYDSLSQ